MDVAPPVMEEGFLQNGVWMNMWITTPAGDRWYQMTDFKKPTNGPSDGYTGVAFTLGNLLCKSHRPVIVI